MPWIDKQHAEQWNNGRLFDAYAKLGAHPNTRGTWFAVWAPHADRVSVIGDFNGWRGGVSELIRNDDCGIWETYVRGAQPGQGYKYHIERGPYRADKTDPFAFAMEPAESGGHPVRGMSAIVTDLSYEWHDAAWMETRRGPSGLHDPIAVYEIHLGSWRHRQPGRSMSYREIAEPLADYVVDLGFTHVELLPILEHPYYASWGYQVTGFFAPTHRYGSPTDFMYLIDTLHQRGIGVLIDWVPAHFATDPQALVYFDGQPLFEYADPIMRHHPDWGTYVFDYAKAGVRNFLISNAHFWFDKYHVDGLRTDAVASMLYRDYSRAAWTPNVYGGRENLEAISLLRELNTSVYARYPEVQMIAEESTAWPGVTRPADVDGLGFLYKWNMGWMHDTLTYMHEDPVYRTYHHDSLTFPIVYAFSEQYILPLSHDEVVHMKGSLWNKMPGDEWQKAANLRLLLGHQIGHPGKKLLFMGGEFGQLAEWNSDADLQWTLLVNRMHAGIQTWLRELLALYRQEPALWDDGPDGFRWIDFEDRYSSVVAYRRIGLRTPVLGADDVPSHLPELVFVFNFTPVVRPMYRLRLPDPGPWRCLLNSDDDRFGGSGLHTVPPFATVSARVGSVAAPASNAGGRKSAPVESDTGERLADHSAMLSLPPLAVLVLTRGSAEQ